MQNNRLDQTSPTVVDIRRLPSVFSKKRKIKKNKRHGYLSSL